MASKPAPEQKLAQKPKAEAPKGEAPKGLFKAPQGIHKDKSPKYGAAS